TSARACSPRSTCRPMPSTPSSPSMCRSTTLAATTASSTAPGCRPTSSSASARSGALVLVDDAVLHDEDDMLHGVDVARGIAGHGDDVGELAGFERAELVGDAEEARVARG